MKNKNYFLLILLFKCYNSLCQVFVEVPAATAPQFNYNKLSSKIDYFKGDTAWVTYSKYTNGAIDQEIYSKGTPFYQNRDFVNEKVYLDGLVANGTIYYDLVNENVFFSANNFEASQTIKPDSFTIGNKKFLRLKSSFINASGYYQEIYNDPYNQIFKKYNCQYKSNYNYQKGKNTDDNWFAGTYEKFNNYYIVKSNYLIRLKNNFGFLKQLGLHEADLKWFAESKKIDFQKEKDIIDILKYYGYLMESKK